MWRIYRILDFIKYLPKEIKWFFQRGFKGYCDRDVYGIDNWFENVIIPMLEQLQKIKQGYPINMTEKQWDIALSNMIYCFKESTEKYCSEKNEYEDEYTKDLFNSREEFNEELRNKWLKREEEIEMYREKMKNEALEMFSKYYYDLWW